MRSYSVFVADFEAALMSENKETLEAVLKDENFTQQIVSDDVAKSDAYRAALKNAYENYGLNPAIEPLLKAAILSIFRRAVEAGKVELVVKLIGDYDRDFLESTGVKWVQIAAQNGHQWVTEALVARSFSRESLLVEAIRTDKPIAELRTLLQWYQLEIVLAEESSVAFREAITRRRSDVVKLLIEMDGKADASVLELAIDRNTPEILALLLYSGMVDDEKSLGDLMVKAIDSKRAQCLQILLSYTRCQEILSSYKTSADRTILQIAESVRETNPSIRAVISSLMSGRVEHRLGGVSEDLFELVVGTELTDMSAGAADISEAGSGEVAGAAGATAAGSKVTTVTVAPIAPEIFIVLALNTAEDIELERHRREIAALLQTKARNLNTIIRTLLGRNTAPLRLQLAELVLEVYRASTKAELQAILERLFSNTRLLEVVNFQQHRVTDRVAEGAIRFFKAIITPPTSGPAAALAAASADERKFTSDTARRLFEIHETLAERRTASAVEMLETSREVGGGGGEAAAGAATEAARQSAALPLLWQQIDNVLKPVSDRSTDPHWIHFYRIEFSGLRDAAKNPADQERLQRELGELLGRKLSELVESFRALPADRGGLLSVGLRLFSPSYFHPELRRLFKFGSHAAVELSIFESRYLEKRDAYRNPQFEAVLRASVIFNAYLAPEAEVQRLEIPAQRASAEAGTGSVAIGDDSFSGLAHDGSRL